MEKHNKTSALLHVRLLKQQLERAHDVSRLRAIVHVKGLQAKLAAKAMVESPNFKLGDMDGWKLRVRFGSTEAPDWMGVFLLRASARPTPVLFKITVAAEGSDVPLASLATAVWSDCAISFGWSKLLPLSDFFSPAVGGVDKMSITVTILDAKWNEVEIE